MYYSKQPISNNINYTINTKFIVQNIYKHDTKKLKQNSLLLSKMEDNHYKK